MNPERSLDSSKKYNVFRVLRSIVDVFSVRVKLCAATPRSSGSKVLRFVEDIFTLQVPLIINEDCSL